MPDIGQQYSTNAWFYEITTTLVIIMSPVTFHNIFTNVAVANTINTILLKSLENGEKA